ncbi:MAG: PIG-L family deacetylase [Clostridia bacterium]|nr:PIG-L family deacetylase [Clostridia bacterium]
MSKKTIMAVGAHTGDAQLTCGMLLCRHALQGDDVIIVDLTAGERGTPPGMTPEQFRPLNVEASGRFAERIGGKSVVLDTPDGELEANRENALALCDIMREYHVDTVLYHWKNSIHRDHVAAHTITEDAIFYASLGTFPRPLPPAPVKSFMCAENWEDAEGFMPYYYYDVTEAFPLWKEAVRELWLAEHASFKYLRYYEAMAVARGALIGKDYGTCFAVPPFVGAPKIVTA